MNRTKIYRGPVHLLPNSIPSFGQTYEETKRALAFRVALQNATLDNGDLSPEELERLRNPSRRPTFDSMDRDLRLSLNLSGIHQVSRDNDDDQPCTKYYFIEWYVGGNLNSTPQTITKGKGDAKKIKETTFSIFNALHTVLNCAPETFGGSGIEALQYIRYYMYQDYDFLALCDFDWKVHYIDTQEYPQWSRSKSLPSPGLLSTDALLAKEQESGTGAVHTVHHVVQPVTLHPIPAKTAVNLQQLPIATAPEEVVVPPAVGNAGIVVTPRESSLDTRQDLTAARGDMNMAVSVQGLPESMIGVGGVGSSTNPAASENNAPPPDRVQSGEESLFMQDPL
ncbi:hypothetical protein CVT24_002432 [Panaeolus cyanescens]|uniref:Uncharacterized protein n=1 Tax=Panaeolus cyanescens TaxID=181874 RepID=A0A409WK12_9AGAR|nr:hypothetical protein CVT24_002432 [Panaeolus cyanescens]